MSGNFTGNFSKISLDTSVGINEMGSGIGHIKRPNFSLFKEPWISRVPNATQYAPCNNKTGQYLRALVPVYHVLLQPAPGQQKEQRTGSI